MQDYHSGVRFGILDEDGKQNRIYQILSSSKELFFGDFNKNKGIFILKNDKIKSVRFRYF